jgi:hypothetical protein
LFINQKRRVIIWRWLKGFYSKKAKIIREINGLQDVNLLKIKQNMPNFGTLRPMTGKNLMGGADAGNVPRQAHDRVSF